MLKNKTFNRRLFICLFSLLILSSCVRQRSITEIDSQPSTIDYQKVFQVESSADGQGSQLSDVVIHPGESLTVFAIERDSNNQFIANVESSWVLVGSMGQLTILEGGKRATFVATRVGAGKIKAITSSATNEVTITVTNANLIKEASFLQRGKLHIATGTQAGSGQDFKMQLEVGRFQSNESSSVEGWKLLLNLKKNE